MPNSQKDHLSFVICGSVDDGKSSLLGRLLFDLGAIESDRLARAKEASKKYGTTGNETDLALLTDGLEAERAQGITIDVAYRYVESRKRFYTIADAPGHVQFTRNMATAASNAEAAIVLVDATNGVTTQTKRHIFILSLFGVKQFAIAINKLDKFRYAPDRYQKTCDELNPFFKQLEIPTPTFIPVSALNGDNVSRKSKNISWYKGTTLFDWLESLNLTQGYGKEPFIMPVQWINRRNEGFRGYAGTIVSGNVKAGQKVRALPSGKKSKIKKIYSNLSEADRANRKEAITLSLTDEIEVSRRDVICSEEAMLDVTDQFMAHLLWFGDEPLLPSRPYKLIACGGEANASITKLKHKISVDNLEKLPADILESNDVGVCNINLDHRIVTSPFTQNHALGSFILIDRLSNETVAAGMIDFSLNRASNIRWQELEVTAESRRSIKGHKPCVIWLTGLSGSGKSTIANLVEKHLFSRNKHTYLLDGDNVRHGLNKDLGFKDEDRVENIRRVAEVAKLMTDAGLITLVSFISPFKAERRMARSLFKDGDFIEVFVDTPLETCEARDSKGLYKKARQGLIPNFTGIDSPYEAPTHAEIHIHNNGISAEDAAKRVIDFLENNGYLT